MSPKWQIGIIGVGMWGRVHLDSVRDEERAEVTCICSRTEQTVKAVQQEYAIRHATTDYQEILADDSVDAVIIATPPHVHGDVFVDALRAGKHVLLEKPVSSSLDEAALMVQEADAHSDLVVLEASCRFSRLNPKFAFVRNMVQKGRLGDIYFVHHLQLKPTTYTEYNPRAEWAADRRRAGGGPMFDWSGYDFSFHLGVLGDRHDLQGVRGFAVNGLRPALGPADPDLVEQHAAALLQFDHGLHYYYERAGGAYGDVPDDTRIHGTRGGLRFDYLPWGGDVVEWYTESSGGKVECRELRVDMAGYSGEHNTELIRHFVDCLDGRVAPVLPIGLAYRHMQMVWRILRDS